MNQQETTENRPESGEAIVVGAIGSAAPWFLTGWIHEVEIEFMIDTGCQVTILSTTVFERMCTVDLAVRSGLRPCLRRVIPRSWRQYRTGMPLIRSKVSDSLLALSDITADLLKILQIWHIPWWP